MSSSMDRLLSIMATLRNPDGGCPWDLEQSFATIAPHTLEEAYEVVEAIEANDKAALKDELGDLLFQVVFYAQMAKEEGSFDFDQIAEAICDKMERRHPHVFGTAKRVDAENHITLWEEQKAAERAEKAATGALDGVSVALPALSRAVKLQKRASRVGFDWPGAEQVFDKLSEEIGELRDELVEHPNQDRIAEEMGDILFVCANLARKLGVDPETALRGCNQKFERRFRHIETNLAAQGRRPEQASLGEMEALWVEAKTLEKGGARE
jgi:ATP diphosphatase